MRITHKTHWQSRCFFTKLTCLRNVGRSVRGQCQCCNDLRTTGNQNLLQVFRSFYMKYFLYLMFCLRSSTDFKWTWLRLKKACVCAPVRIEQRSNPNVMTVVGTVVLGNYWSLRLRIQKRQCLSFILIGKKQALSDSDFCLDVPDGWRDLSLSEHSRKQEQNHITWRKVAALFWHLQQ